MTLDPRTDPVAIARNAEWVQRLARRLLQDVHLAEDVAQDALTAAFTREGGFDSPGGLRRWLARTTRHLAWRAGSREREQHRREARAARPEAGDDPLDRLLLQRRLIDALLGLDEPYRESLVLHLLDDLPPREIARRLGISPAAARQRLSRGLARLRARLEGELGEGRLAPALVALVSSAGRVTSMVVWTEAVLMGVKTVAVVIAATVVIGLVWWGTGDVRPGFARPVPAEERVDAARVEPGRVEGGPATSERRLVAAAGAPLRRLVWVVDENGRALPDATVLLLAEERLVTSSGSDASGSVEVEATADLAVAAAPGRPAVALELDGDEHEAVLTLGPGERLAGYLRVDGASPERSVTLSLLHDQSLEARLPQAAAQALRAAGLAQPEAVPVASDGSFAATGLATGWSGTIALPEWLWLTRDPAPGARDPRARSRAALPRATRDLVLDTVRLPTVRGRFVWEEEDGPVPHAEYTFDYMHAEGGSAGPGRAGADGRFEQVLVRPSAPPSWADPVQRPALRSVAISVTEPWTIFRWEGGELPADGDVGDLPLKRLAWRGLHFEVVYGDGAALAGAVLSVLGDLYSVDPEGRGLVPRFPRGEVPVEVDAPGLRTERITVPPDDTDADHPFRIVLDQRVNRLELALRDQNDRVPRRSKVELYGPEPVFVGRSLLGRKGWLMSSLEGDHRSFVYILDDQGEAVFEDLTPGIALELRVRDVFDRVVLTKKVLAPPAGEERREILVLHRTLASLRGRVLGAAGEPLAQARARVRLRGRGRDTKSGPDGDFVFEGLLCGAGPVTLLLSHPGHAPHARSLELEGELDLGEIQLQAAAPLVLVLEDPSGRPVEVREVTASLPAAPDHRGGELEPGRFEFPELPVGPVTFRTEHGPHTYERTFEPARPSDRWVLPAHGELVVAVTADLDLPQGRYAFARVRCEEEAGDTGAFSLPWEGGQSSRPYPLRPGRWELELCSRTKTSDAATERGTGRTWSVRIEAGTTTTLRIE